MSIKNNLRESIINFSRPEDLNPLQNPEHPQFFNEKGLRRRSFRRGDFLPNPENPMDQAIIDYENHKYDPLADIAERLELHDIGLEVARNIPDSERITHLIILSRKDIFSLLKLK